MDWSGDLYGQDVTVAFADWLRPEQAFAGPEPLIAAMHADVGRARERLAALGPPRD
jgi:riboflavin kinase/FMN adenylyltransferase